MTDTLTLGNSTLANDLKLPPQAKTILRHLEKGKSITPMESLIVYGIYRLSDCIFKLRNAGHDILTADRVDERGKKYGEYRLNSRLILG
jgi:hypothetical protein